MYHLRVSIPADQVQQTHQEGRGQRGKTMSTTLMQHKESCHSYVQEDWAAHNTSYTTHRHGSAYFSSKLQVPMEHSGAISWSLKEDMEETANSLVSCTGHLNPNDENTDTTCAQAAQHQTNPRSGV
jgi:hypothetical protein